MELEAAARMSIMSNDLVLASAVAQVVDRLPRDRRPFALGDFAQAVMGTQFEDADRKLKAVLFALRSATQPHSLLALPVHDLCRCAIEHRAMWARAGAVLDYSRQGRL